MDKKYITRTEAAKKFNLAKTTLPRQEASGKIKPAIKILDEEDGRKVWSWEREYFMSWWETKPVQNYGNKRKGEPKPDRYIKNIEDVWNVQKIGKPFGVIPLMKLNIK